VSDDRPSVSIGVPVYNGEATLPDALESLAAQTLEDFEVILCDNDSSDGTEAICRAWAERDPRFRYFRNTENLGAAGNFNRAFELSEGDYFKWLAADDTLEPDYLRVCMDTFGDAPDSVVMCFPRRRFLRPDGSFAANCDLELPRRVDHQTREIRTIRYAELLRLGDEHAPAIVFGLIRSDLLRRTGLIRPYKAADVVLNAELALYGELWQLPERLYNQRMHSANSARARMSEEEEARWYDPSASAGTANLGWQLLREHARCIRRAKIPAHQKAARLRDLGSLPPARALVAFNLARGEAKYRLIRKLSDRSQPRIRTLKAWMLYRQLRRAAPPRWKAIADQLRGVDDELVLQHFLTACVDTAHPLAIVVALRWLEGSDTVKRRAAAAAIAERSDLFRNLERDELSTELQTSLDEALAGSP